MNNLHQVFYHAAVDEGTEKGIVIAQVRDAENIRRMAEEGFPTDRPFGPHELLCSSLSENPATMTQMFFLQKTFFKPLYSPMFIHQKKMYLFDHANDRLLEFWSKEEAPFEKPISHHKEKGFKQQIISDSQTGKVYALYEKNSRYSLREINLRTGEPSGNWSVPKAFPSQFKVRNGVLYFMYKETNYEDVKRLYRMQL